MRSIAISAGILALSLAGAWVQWQTEPTQIGVNEILILDGKADDLASIIWQSETTTATLETRSDSFGEYLWVEYEDRKNPEKPHTKTFKAGSEATRLQKDLSPLIGIRRLDDIEDLQTIGLADSTTSMILEKKGQKHEFLIGNEAYGTKDFYVQYKNTGEVFLIDDKKLRNLVNARTALLDRTLWSAKPAEATAISITWNDIRQDFSHLNKQDAKEAKWIFVAQQERDNTQLETWLSKFSTLTASRYPIERDEIDDLRPSFTVTITWDNAIPETMTLFQTENGWWAQSEHTRTKVKITGKALNSLFEDLPALMQADEK